MPLYEYICSECHYIFEEIQKISDAPLKKCPQCQRDTLAKQISQSSFALKGEGWYKDGYARPSEKKNSTEK